MFPLRNKQIKQYTKIPGIYISNPISFCCSQLKLPCIISCWLLLEISLDLMYLSVSDIFKVLIVLFRNATALCSSRVFCSHFHFKTEMFGHSLLGKKTRVSWITLIWVCSRIEIFFLFSMRICKYMPWTIHLSEHKTPEHTMNTFVSWDSCCNPKYITSYQFHCQASVQLFLARDFI